MLNDLRHDNHDGPLIPISCIRFPRTSLSVFACCKQSKTKGVEGLGTRLHIHCNMVCTAGMYDMGGHSHVHTWVAGSGFHLPSASHVAVIVLFGTNPELHLKDIWAPSVVFWYGLMKPLPGVLGAPQLTEGEEGERNYHEVPDVPLKVVDMVSLGRFISRASTQL